jgi:hypothetical protein
MSNFNFKLDLSKFEGFGKVTLTGKSGQAKRCIVIPIEGNSVFEGEKGTYIDLVCFETPNSEYGSHMVTLSKTKEEQEHEKQTGERVRKPIVGNLKPFGNSQASSGEEYSLPNQAAAQQVAQQARFRKAEMTNENLNNTDDGDGLPFD